MKLPFPTRSHLVPLLVAAVAVLACDSSPTDPGGEVNEELARAANGSGFAVGGLDLPQGSAAFTGPGGMAMEATANEFIQQLTLTDGTVLQTSGLAAFAVPDASVDAPVVDFVSFGAANTGSLASVNPGRFDIVPLPRIDFVTPIEFGYGRVRETADDPMVYSSDGEITIVSFEYFDDVYTCDLPHTSLTIDLCEYQLGMVRGIIEFTVTLEDGTEVVQERTEFTLPVRKQTIIARE